MKMLARGCRAKPAMARPSHRLSFPSEAGLPNKSLPSHIPSPTIRNRIAKPTRCPEGLPMVNPMRDKLDQKYDAQTNAAASAKAFGFERYSAVTGVPKSSCLTEMGQLAMNSKRTATAHKVEVMSNRVRPTAGNPEPLRRKSTTSTMNTMAHAAATVPAKLPSGSILLI